jgi:methyl-accepting chemotaxis protein
MATVAQQIALGDVNHDIEVHSKDEIGTLAEAFRGLIGYMKELAGIAESVAERDLRVVVKPRSENDALGHAFQTMVRNLTGMIRSLGENAGQLVTAANEVASTSEQMSRGAKDQTDQVTQVSTAIEEMTATIVESSKNAGEASSGSRGASETATNGGQVVADTIQGMQKIASVVRESASSIGELAKSQTRTVRLSAYR